MIADLESVAARLDRLEKQNRLLKRAWIATLLTFGMSIAMILRAADTPRTVEAEKFILRDASGRTKAQLSSDNTGSELRFFDDGGKIRLGVGVYVGAPNVTLFDKDENQVGPLVSDETGSQLWFGAGAVGKPPLSVGTKATLAKNGKPALTSFLLLRDTEGNGRVEIQHSPVFEESSINVYDKRGKLIWSKP